MKRRYRLLSNGIPDAAVALSPTTYFTTHHATPLIISLGDPPDRILALLVDWPFGYIYSWLRPARSYFTCLFWMKYASQLTSAHFKLESTL